jgi:hypothetical protein
MPLLIRAIQSTRRTHLQLAFALLASCCCLGLCLLLLAAETAVDEFDLSCTCTHACCCVCCFCRLVIDVTPVHVPRPGATSHSLSTPVLCQQAIPARPALLAVRVYVCVVKVLSLSASVCENVLVQTATKHRLMKCSNTVSPASV